MVNANLDWLVEKADAFAKTAHMGQTRKYTNEPYIWHPRRALELLVLTGVAENNPWMQAAMLLHDTVEDTSVTLEDIKREFGPRVAALVQEVTDVAKLKDGNRKQRSAINNAALANASVEGQNIKLADIYDNIRDILDVAEGDYAVQYLHEKLATIEVLTKANPSLRGYVITEINIRLARVNKR